MVSWRPGGGEGYSGFQVTGMNEGFFRLESFNFGILREIGKLFFFLDSLILVAIL